MDEAGRIGRSWLRAALVVALLAATALAWAWAPTGAAAADSTTCGYATPGSGAYSRTICWFDMSPYVSATSRSAAGQPMSVQLGGGYSVSFTVLTTNVVGRNPFNLAPVATPIETRFAFGTAGYAGIPGKPALYTLATAGANKSVLVTLDDIVVTDAQGAPVSGYSFVIADAENNVAPAGESFTWTSDKPLNLLEVLNPNANQGCHNALTGLGTTSVTCVGYGTDPVPSQPYDGVLVKADGPSRIALQLNTNARSGAAFGIMTSRLTVSKQVASRVVAGDGFDLAVTSPEGSLIGSASTGESGTTATTGPLTVLPRSTGGTYTLGEAMSSGSLSPLSDYAQTWACTTNGTADPTLSGSVGPSLPVTPKPGDDIACTVTNTAAAKADLSLVKRAIPDPALPGQNVTYRLTVKNAGPSTARNVTVTDPLPAGVSFVSASPGCAASGGTVACTVAALASGAAQSFDVTGSVAASSTGSLVNTAKVTSDTPDPNPSDDTASITTPVRQLADLTITKTADPLSVLLGETASYTLTVVNHGPSTANDVVVTDTAGDGITPMTAAPSQGSCSSPSSCQLGPLASGATATVIVTATSTALGTVGNTAAVSSTTADPDPSDNVDSASIVVRPQADLSIVKKASAEKVSEGEDFTYTLTVKNAGPATAADVTVTDALPAGVAVRGVRTPRGTCGQADPVVCRLGDLPSGATATVTLNVTATDAGRFVNGAVVTSPTPDPDLADNQGSSAVDTSRKADLAITKSASADTVLLGQSFTYTLTVENRGPSRATGVVVTDPLPDGLQLDAVTTSAGTCDGAAVLVCKLAALRAGQRETVRVTATATKPGPVSNGASVTSETFDPAPANNTAQAAVQVAARADLRISKTASTDLVAAGGTVVYGIVVTNEGPNAASAVTVTDAVPEGARVLSATSSAGRCEAAGAIVCRVGDLPDGGSATVRLTVVFDQPGSTRNVAMVTSSTPDPSPGSNGSETEVTSEKADLSIAKTASTRSPKLGGAVTYRIQVTNRGPSGARGVTVTDPIPAGMRVTAVTTTAGSCTTAEGAIVCALGDLAAGAQPTVTVRAIASREGKAVNAASVVAAFPSDPDQKDNLAAATVTVQPGAAKLALAKRASRRIAKAGDRVRYRITVTNVSRRAAGGVRVCDRLPDGLVLVDRGGARLTRGQACWKVSRLAPRARRTFTVVARVLAGGPARLTNAVTASGANARVTRAAATIRRAAQRTKAGGVTG